MAGETGGPYVQMAVICERALQEKDGVFSIIRVIDRVIISASGAAPPEEMPPGIIAITIVIMLKAGFIRARHNLRIVPTTPSGQNLPELSAGVLLEGDDRGVNLIFNVQLPAREEGLYWFDVLFENQLLTRIPLRILYQRVTQAPLFEKQ